jgi:hypothetical protein
MEKLRMTLKQNIRVLLVLGLIFVSLGGWMLHVRIHPPTDLARNFIPFITGIIGIIIVPAMFFPKKTRAYAYVINGMMVIIGTITMAHFSLARLAENPVTLEAIFLGTILCDIFILFTNFFIGKALFELDLFSAVDAPMRHGRFWRYPNMGWWWVHVATLSTAYMLEFVLWK